MNISRRIKIIAAFPLCVLAVFLLLNPTVPELVFELPSGFQGPFVVKCGIPSDGTLIKVGQRWVIRIEKGRTTLSNFDETWGAYFNYLAKIGRYTEIEMIRLIDAQDNEVYFFGGPSTSDNESHFFVGSRDQAEEYFANIPGPRDEVPWRNSVKQ